MSFFSIRRPALLQEAIKLVDLRNKLIHNINMMMGSKRILKEDCLNYLNGFAHNLLDNQVIFALEKLIEYTDKIRSCEHCKRMTAWGLKDILRKQLEKKDLEYIRYLKKWLLAEAAVDYLGFDLFYISSEKDAIYSINHDKINQTFNLLFSWLNCKENKQSKHLLGESK